MSVRNALEGKVMTVQGLIDSDGLADLGQPTDDFSLDDALANVG